MTTTVAGHFVEGSVVTEGAGGDATAGSATSVTTNALLEAGR